MFVSRLKSSHLSFKLLEDVMTLPPLVALLVVCAIAYCLTQVRIATALERALSLMESEAQRRAEAEERIAEQMRQEEAKERLNTIKRLEGKSSPTTGFTAMPFAAA